MEGATGERGVRRPSRQGDSGEGARGGGGRAEGGRVRGARGVSVFVRKREVGRPGCGEWWGEGLGGGWGWMPNVCCVPLARKSEAQQRLGRGCDGVSEAALPRRRGLKFR